MSNLSDTKKVPPMLAQDAKDALQNADSEAQKAFIEAIIAYGSAWRILAETRATQQPGIVYDNAWSTYATARNKVQSAFLEMLNAKDTYTEALCSFNFTLAK